MEPHDCICVTASGHNVFSEDHDVGYWSGLVMGINMSPVFFNHFIGFTDGLG
jgi:hypothetical protein